MGIPQQGQLLTQPPGSLRPSRRPLAQFIANRNHFRTHLSNTVQDFSLSPISPEIGLPVANLARDWVVGRHPPRSGDLGYVIAGIFAGNRQGGARWVIVERSSRAG